jgi:hypothetical protein
VLRARLARLVPLLAVIFSIGITPNGLLPALGVASAASTIADTDWAQFGPDAQRIDVSPQTVSGPYRYYWRWTDVPFACRVQPVVAGGDRYVGGLTGIMYALDAAADTGGGSPPILWQ